MTASTGSISLQEASEALRRSGYLLEARIEHLLTTRRYYVDANDAYPDPATGKSRELDLTAMYARRVSRDYDFVFNVLLIECVNNPQPLVLLTKQPQAGFLFHEDIRLAGLATKLFDTAVSRWVSLQVALHMEKFHHYCVRRVATQFCSFTKKSNQDWMAQHEGSHFDSFSKLCDAVEWFQDRHFKSWRFSDAKPINIEFYYPVLIVQRDLLEGHIRAHDVVLRPAKHLQFRRTAVRGSQPTVYQIDVVQESGVPRFISTLDNELDLIAQRLKARTRLVRDSITKIVAKTRRLRSPEAIRKAMEIA